LQHEVGTHVVTHANGAAQPLQLLQVGLPGYEESQEGLATFAEYVVGGLTKPRLATIAGRVIAARALVDGASFVETYRVLTTTWGFTAPAAFAITTRIHRGGGLTKDSIYLRGLRGLLGYLGTGGTIEPLLAGKLPLTDVGIVEELMWRRVLRPPVLRPRWLDHPGAEDRLSAISEGKTVTEIAAEVAA
jgi:uncharacterized protein (TIGR02421 family)